MLDDLIDASRMVQGTLRLDVRQIDLMTPLREALETLAPAFRAKTLQVHVAAHDALDPIDADHFKHEYKVIWRVSGCPRSIFPRTRGRLAATPRLLCDGRHRMAIAKNQYAQH